MSERATAAGEGAAANGQPHAGTAARVQRDALLAELIDAAAERAVERVFVARGQVESDRWMDVAEAADYMRCSRQRVYDLLHQGRWAGGHDGRRRVIRRGACDAHSKPVRVLYVSDFDPASAGMPPAVARQAEFFGRHHPELTITLDHVALTGEQVDRHGLPGEPLDENDRRSTRFEQAHGDRRVELDARSPSARGARERCAPCRRVPIATSPGAVSWPAPRRKRQTGAVWRDATADLRAELDRLRKDAAADGSHRERFEHLRADLELWRREDAGRSLKRDAVGCSPGATGRVRPA